MRPRSITIIGSLFIVLGGATLIAAIRTLFETTSGHPMPGTSTFVLVFLVRIAALVGGIFLLGGQNWARWLVVAWMLFHILVGLLNSVFESVLHVLIFGTIYYFLFRPEANAFFQKTPPAQGASEPGKGN